MKIILLAVLLLVCAGCEMPSHKERVDDHADYLSGKIVVVDSCEYFECTMHYGTQLTHKGNCKNCREFYKELFKRVPQ